MEKVFASKKSDAMSSTERTSAQADACPHCNDQVRPRRIPFGKTGSYLDVIGCRVSLCASCAIPEDNVSGGSEGKGGPGLQ
jgi:hypothetical protein